MAVLLETAWGDLMIDLDLEGSPELCKNVLKLAKARFYTNSLIFSVTPGRFCEAGCPVGDGTGGCSIYGLLDETCPDYRKSTKRFLKNSQGRPLTLTERQEKGRVVATCQGGIPDTIGSQFLITIDLGPDRALDGYKYHSELKETDAGYETMFLSLGMVSEDENNVLDKIADAYTDRTGRPYADIRIIRCLVVYDPFDDPPGMDKYCQKVGISFDETGWVIESPSPERPTEERVEIRIPVSEIDDVDNEEDAAKLREREREAQRKEDHGRAVVLEMLGDLPDADIKAPENVLFICKLNPVTQDEDLELIFSRFDSSVKVEIIRDRDTGNSLQYAFAEFTTEQQAAEAYFKMNNALVDDRRIKVDFSQSVAKLWDKYRQKARMPRAGPGGTFNATEFGGGNRIDDHKQFRERTKQEQGATSSDHLRRDSSPHDTRYGEQSRYYQKRARDGRRHEQRQLNMEAVDDRKHSRRERNREEDSHQKSDRDRNSESDRHRRGSHQYIRDNAHHDRERHRDDNHRRQYTDRQRIIDDDDRRHRTHRQRNRVDGDRHHRPHHERDEKDDDRHKRTDNGDDRRHTHGNDPEKRRADDYHRHRSHRESQIHITSDNIGNGDEEDDHPRMSRHDRNGEDVDHGGSIHPERSGDDKLFGRKSGRDKRGRDESPLDETRRLWRGENSRHDSDEEEISHGQKDSDEDEKRRYHRRRSREEVHGRTSRKEKRKKDRGGDTCSEDGSRRESRSRKKRHKRARSKSDDDDSSVMRRDRRARKHEKHRKHRKDRDWDYDRDTHGDGDSRKRHR